MIDARSAAADDGGEVAMIGRVEIGRVTNAPTKFCGIKGIGIAELDELCDQVGSL